MRHVLSKSTFLYGAQCLKRLYFHKFRRDLIPEISDEQQAIFDTGSSVGELARELFPGGIDASPPSPYEYQRSVKLTNQLIDSGKRILYEAAFQHDGVLAAIDILVKRNGKWKAYEVKSSTSVKDVNLIDAALQYHVITQSGIDLSDIFIVHINNEYTLGPELVKEEFFRIESVKDSCIELQGHIKEKINELKTLIRKKEQPEVDIGPHCSTPYECSFIEHCWKHIPAPSVFDLSRMRADKKFELYEKGMIRLEDLDEEVKLSAYQKLQVSSHLNQETVIDKTGIRNFLDQIAYPVYFMDFETFAPAVPLYRGTRPYQQIPFQYSLHYKKNKKSVPVHSDFLAEAGLNDPRIPFLANLLRDTNGQGTILCYNASFEKMILNQLAGDFPKYAAAIEEIMERIVDLMSPFREGLYYKPRMNGSYSIKEVLPALVPDLDYELLEINNGSSASLAFVRMIYDQSCDKESIRKNLQEYCKLDTLAMVRILEVLEAV
jgi:hypothetical protein